MLQESKTRRKHGVAFTMGQARKALHPYPVYECHFQDRTVVRMSFWTKGGKPFDFASGRRSCELHRGMTAIAGFVEHDDPGKPWVRVADPHFTSGAVEPAKAKPKATRKEIIKELARMTDYAEHLQAALAKHGSDFTHHVTLDRARAVIAKAA